MDDRTRRPVPSDGEPPWAHVSGWAQLSGARHTVSCVLPCGQDPGRLQRVLPTLSDTLTECGYPWELLLVNQQRRDDIGALLHGWLVLPGFRLVEPPAGLHDGGGFATGLMLARGDAVILCDAGGRHSPGLIAAMISRWESDALLVYASQDDGDGPSLLRHWDLPTARARVGAPGFALPPECTELGLIDRQLVDWMTGGG